MTTEHISKELFKTILQDSEVTKPNCLELLQGLYSFNNHEASATDLAELLGYKDKIVVNSIIGKFGKRVEDKYGVQGEAYYDIFFNGHWEEAFYIWELKPELIKAMEELSLNKIPQKKETTNTFLFIWNSKPESWDDYENCIKDFKLSNVFNTSWRCNTKNIKSGDRAFLIKVGSYPKGIIASGVTKTSSIKYEKENGNTAYYVELEFDVFFDYKKEKILELETLKTGELAKQNWTPQLSGISVRPELVNELEKIWSDFLTTQGVQQKSLTLTNSEVQQAFIEGTAKEVILTRYERDPNARNACIKHYGYSCSVCSFDFEKQYGEIGKNFIHVHHLTEISSIGESYEIDPIKDLRPVCPNCHAMIHRKKPLLSIEELKRQIQ